MCIFTLQTMRFYNREEESAILRKNERLVASDFGKYQLTQQDLSMEDM